MGAALPCAASGGAFRDFSYADMQKLAKEDPLALHAKATTHPNWNMGAKITCDSATLMNKALEVRARTVPARRSPALPAQSAEPTATLRNECWR